MVHMPVLVMNITVPGANEDMLEGLAEGTIILSGGYKVPFHDEMIDIFRNSL